LWHTVKPNPLPLHFKGGDRGEGPNHHHMKKITLITLLLTLIFSITTHAQSSDLGNWLIYFGNKKINSQWNWHHEVQYRNYNAIGDLEQLLLRTGIGYNLTENNNNLLLGYGFIHSQNYLDNTEDKVMVDEHRIFQQFITRQSIARVKVQHRYRFEQRWIEDTDFRLRFRYFLALNIPVNKPGSAGQNLVCLDLQRDFSQRPPTGF
jgi:hypothetical protein